MAATTRVIDAPRAAGESFPPKWVYLFLGLWAALSLGFKVTYKEEDFKSIVPKVAGMLGLVFTIFFGGRALAYNLPPEYVGIMLITVLVGILGFLLYKLGRRLGTVAELITAFVLRGHWYLLPLLIVLLSIGSLLVVAASSPFVAPFIYTLF